MAEETESSLSKKRRVIHWNPEAGHEQTRRRWTWKRIAAWGAGGFLAVLIVAGIINRLPKIFGAPTLSDMLSGRQAEVAVADTVADASTRFISRAKAEQARELASKALGELRKLPTDHPSELQQMILLEKSLIQGEAHLAAHEWGRAFQTFENLNQDVDTFAKNVKAKGEAKQGYDAIMLRIKDLESARSLAPGALDAAFEAAAQGRQLLTDGNFIASKKAFDRGFAELKKAEESLANYVKENLLIGQRSLANGQKEEAKQAFQNALEKAPGNEAATLGLKRAENTDRVHALLLQGGSLEKQGQYAAAAESYAKAFALDAQSAEAQQGQARAARLEKETKFAASKTAAEEAVKQRDWTKAIAEFQNALKVYPNKTDVQAALKSAKENAHKDAVAKAMAKAFAHESQHKWNEARRAYDEVMQLDANHAEAKEGYTRAGTIIRALLQYNALIESSEQLANKADFQGALKRFNEALTYKPDYLDYSERVLQLRRVLQEQSKPVEVTFKSDGKTYVSIVGFKTPQQFETVTLKIMPGDYHVIGRRQNYRAVEFLLQVRNGVPPPVVTVACSSRE